MQTFLPYKDFSKSAEVLDDRRLYKQIVECKQILTAIEANEKNTKYGFQNHPIVKMWQNHKEALKYYQWCMFKEWAKRRWNFDIENKEIILFKLPSWMGDDEFHYSHRCNLLRKDKNHYENYFSEGEHYDVNEVEYKWMV